MKAIDRALLVAKKAHSNQHYDIYPYMYHIRQVLGVAQDLGFDEEVQVGCALHDTIEDGDLSYNDIKDNFGEPVAEIVYAVTDELGRNRRERKAKTYPKIQANTKATLVKICDRIANASHSKEYTPSLFRMYTKEHKDFYDLLICGNPDIQKALDVLNKVME